MDYLDISLLRELENGLPLVPEPFEEVGRRLGLTGAEVRRRVRSLEAEGIIRKFRARINQRIAGISANALVAWKPDDAAKDTVSTALAGFPGVTHCYERRSVPGRWEYTIYTVHHGSSREVVRSEVRTIAETIGVTDYAVLFSTTEFKRVPNVRITENGGGVM